MLETIIYAVDRSVHYYKMTTGKSKTSTGDKMSRVCHQADSISSVRWHKQKVCACVLSKYCTNQAVLWLCKTEDYASMNGKYLLMFQCAASIFRVQQSNRIWMLFLDC